MFSIATKVSFNWLAIHVKANGVEVLRESYQSNTGKKNLQQQEMHCITDELMKWRTQDEKNLFSFIRCVLWSWQKAVKERESERERGRENCVWFLNETSRKQHTHTDWDERMKRKGCALFQNYLWLLSNKCETICVWVCKKDRENKWEREIEIKMGRKMCVSVWDFLDEEIRSCIAWESAPIWPHRIFP